MGMPQVQSIAGASRSCDTIARTARTNCAQATEGRADCANRAR
jgi:hypothetical protein